MEQFREELLGAIQEVRDDMLLALNEAVDRNNKAKEGNASLLTTLQADIESLREETLRAINKVVDQNDKVCQANASLIATLQETIDGLKNELDTTKAEVRRLRTRLDANGSSGVTGVASCLEPLSWKTTR